MQNTDIFITFCQSVTFSNTINVQKTKLEPAASALQGVQELKFIVPIISYQMERSVLECTDEESFEGRSKNS